MGWKVAILNEIRTMEPQKLIEKWLKNYYESSGFDPGTSGIQK